MVRVKKTQEQKDKQRRINFLNACRKAFIFSDAFTLCYERARVGKKYRCAICEELFAKCHCHIDHIDSVTPYDKRQYEMSETEVKERVFTGNDNVRCLCHSCHDSVTKDQAKLRTYRKKVVKERK